MSGSATLPLKIAIVDSEPAARFGLSSYLEATCALQVFREIEKAAHSDQLFEEPNPDVILVDTDLDGGGGFQVIRLAQRASKPIPCVAWLRRSNPHDVLLALKAGAKGIVCRRDPLSEVPLALLSAASGYRHLSESAAIALGEGVIVHQLFDCQQPVLPPRQLQVFRLLGEGMSPEKTARCMGVSIKTVYAHIERLKARLSCRDQAALCRLAALAPTAVSGAAS